MIGVFLTTFNFLDQTRRCLESFHRATADCPHKLVVVDNCSTDGTLEYLCGQGYEVIANDRPVSLARAMNQGMERFLDDPDVQAVCWIENDMIFYPGWLSRLVSVLDAHPEIGKLASWNVSGRLFSDEEIERFVAAEAGYLRIGNGVPWLLPKPVIREVGPHDEEYLAGGEYEDWDYNNRLLAHGLPPMVTRRSVVWHQGAATRPEVHPPRWEDHNRRRYEEKWGHVSWGRLHPDLSSPFYRGDGS